MFNIFQTGVSGLLASQAALATTGHNISNAGTDGYSRQEVGLSARTAQQFGRSFIGTGVEVGTVRRIYDTFLARQLQVNTAAFHRMDALHSLSSQVDNTLADINTSVSAGLQGFFDSLNDLSNDPSGIPVRQVMLGEAQGMVERFEAVDARLRGLAQEVNGRLSNSVSEINQLADALARLNEQIVGSPGDAPNDLLDQRDVLLRELNTHIDVTTLQQDDGATNVFIGNGLVLVRGFEAESLALTPSRFDAERSEIVYNGALGSTSITSSLTGGMIGGTLQFRDEVLEPARSALGQTALALTTQFNAQHRSGMTLNGELGGDLFSAGGPLALGAADNTGSAIASVSITDLGGLTGQDYQFTFDGADWVVRDAISGEAVPFTGTGSAGDPFVIGGMTVEFGAGADVGDTFLVRPTAGVVDGLSLLVSDPKDIAAAAAIQASASTSNLGDASVTSGVVSDASDPNLLVGVDIQFLDASNYTINGTGPFAYTSGDTIAFNGWEVQVSGTPAAGDVFSVASNTGGTGDNRNALAMIGVQSSGILQSGTMSVEESYDALVGQVGSSTRAVQLNVEAQGILLNSAEQQVLAVSGVNLDEEAANLLRFQQSYSAAAEVIRVADELFDSLIGAIR